MTTQTYDKQMLLDWLQQLLGELKVQQLTLEGEAIPPGLEEGIKKFSGKWGGQMIVTGFDNGGEDGARQKLAQARHEHFNKTMAFFTMLQELGIFKVNRQGPA